MLKLNGNSGFQLSHKPSQTIANPRKVSTEELLRWTYQDQCADQVAWRIRATMKPGTPRSNMAIIARQGLLGTKIDCAGAGAAGGLYLHRDAEIVHDAVCDLPGDWPGTVIEYAKACGVPECLPDASPRPVGVPRANGKPKIIYHDREGRRPSHCLIRYEPDPEYLDYIRAVYADWWRAVSSLSARIKGLEAHILTGVSSPEMPWKKMFDRREKN